MMMQGNDAPRESSQAQHAGKKDRELTHREISFPYHGSVAFDGAAAGSFNTAWLEFAARRGRRGEMFIQDANRIEHGASEPAGTKNTTRGKPTKGDTIMRQVFTKLVLGAVLAAGATFAAIPEAKAQDMGCGGYGGPVRYARDGGYDRWDSYDRVETIPGHYETRTQMVTIPGHYDMVSRQVWDGCAWRTVCEQVWTPARCVEQQVQVWIPGTTRVVRDRRWAQ